MKSIENNALHPVDEEVNLTDLFITLWNAKWFVGIVTASFFLCSLIYALLLPNQYESFVILSPTSDDESSVLGGMSSQLGGLASLAGMQIGAGKSTESDQAITVMESWAFIEDFIQKQNIDKEIFAVKKWNPSNNSFVYDKKFIDANNEWILEEKPTSWKIYQEFNKKDISIYIKQLVRDVENVFVHSFALIINFIKSIFLISFCPPIQYVSPMDPL